VRLPLNPGARAPAPPSQSILLRAPGAPESLVLVIEDNVDARETLKSLLEAYGCAVEAAATGEEGLQRLLSLRPARAGRLRSRPACP